MGRNGLSEESDVKSEKNGTSLSSEKGPNIKKELKEATALYTGLITSMAAEYHYQEPFGK